jgi:hypothetical protein
MRYTRFAALLVVGALLSSCGGSSEPSGPTAGVLSLTLNTPNTSDGAILFRVNGGVVDSIAGNPVMVASGSYNTFTGNLTRVVIAGPITDGAIAYLFVPDVGKVASYTITIEQVVANATYAQRSTAGYSMAVAVVP